jgi:hypothetical protein
MLQRMKVGLSPLVLAVMMGSAIGWWAHGGSVHAAPITAPVQFQLSGNGNALSLYYPSDRMLYVYPAQSGANNTYCSYSVHIEAEGGAIQRQNCDPGKLF